MFEWLDLSNLEWVGERFRYARRVARLTPGELVREAGFPDVEEGLALLDTLERGEPPVQEIEVLRRFAEALELDLDQLWSEVSHRETARHHRRLAEAPPAFLGSLLSEGRCRAGLTIEEVIQRISLESVLLDRRRLVRLESGEARFPQPTVVDGICKSLNLSVELGRRALAMEGAYYDRMDRSPRVFVRHMPAIYERLCGRQFLRVAGHKKQGLTLRLVSFASCHARQNEKKTAIELPDRRTIYLEPDGSRRESWRPPRAYLR